MTTTVNNNNEIFTGSNAFSLDSLGNQFFNVRTLSGTVVTAMSGASGSTGASVSNRYGVTFTISTGITITALKIQTAFWTGAGATRTANIYSGSTIIFTTTVTKNTIIGNYYVQSISYNLPAGTYSLGFVLPAGDTIYSQNLGMTWDSNLTSITGWFNTVFNTTLSNYIPIGNFEFGVGSSNIYINTGSMTLYNPTFNNNGNSITFPNTAGTIIISAANNSFSGINTITNATASTTTSTGALVVTGGVGIGGALNIGSTVSCAGSSITVTGTNPSINISGTDQQIATATSPGSYFSDAAENTLCIRNVASVTPSICIGHSGDDSDISIDNLGNVTFNTGLYLPTSGGTAALLNYYETETLSVTWTGVWSVGQGGTIYLTKLGRMVVLHTLQTNAAGNTAALVTTSTLIPARYLPNSGSNIWYHEMPVVSNGTIVSGGISISTGGTITIYGTASFGNFPASGSNGVACTSVCWTV